MKGGGLGYNCSSDGTVSWGATKGAILFIKASCNPSAKIVVGVAKVEITKAAIKEGKFVVDLSPPQLDGTFKLKFKNESSGKETGVLYQIGDCGGAEITIELDDILLASKDSAPDHIDNYDGEKFDTVVALWEVPDPADPKKVIPSHAVKFQDVSIVTVLKKWRLTKYFTPVWDAVWDGPRDFTKGCYYQPDKDIPAELINVTLNVALLNMLSPETQGVAIIQEDGETRVIRVYQPGEDGPAQPNIPGFEKVTWPDGAGYIMWPWGTQTDGYCSGGHWLKADSAAVHVKSKFLKCGDPVYVPSVKNDTNPKVRVVEDRGGFGGDSHDPTHPDPLQHIDLWSGRGGSALKREIYDFTYDRTCLRLNR